MFLESRSDFRQRGFHGTSYESQAKGAQGVQGKGFHKANNFVCTGVERNGGAIGFAYGSEVSYNRSDQEMKRRDRLASETSLNELKFKKQQKDAEHDIQSYHNAREQMQQEKFSEKKRDLEQLQTYKPWGRPAPGAPRFTKSGALDMRKKRLELGVVDSIQHTPSEEYQPFGRPGAGAPLRTASGELHTQIPTNPTIRFQDHLKGEVEGSLRYKNAGGSRQEERFEGVRVYRTDSEKDRMVNAREKKLLYGRRLEEQRIEMLERKAAEKAEEKALSISTYPWGKNKVDRDESGKVKRRKWQLGQERSYMYAETNNGIAFQLGQPGAGAPLRDSAGILQTRRFQPDAKPPLSQFDPWGKPGAGAPIKSKEGEIVTTVCGKIGKDSVTKHLEKSGLQDSSQPTKLNPVTGEINPVTTINKTKRGDSKASNRQHFTELQLQAEHRQQELKHSKDLERKQEQEHAEHAAHMWEDKHSRRAQPFSRTSWDGEDEEDGARKKAYYEHLQGMVNERKLHKAQSRETAIQKEKEHVLAYAGQWGRPGGGAPRRTRHGELDVSPRNLGSMLETHTGEKFRRT